jgi:putative nucleotidyltransferase with HDIG domain
MSDDDSFHISLETPLAVTRVEPGDFIASDFGLRAVSLDHLAADQGVPADVFLPLLPSADESVRVARVLTAGQTASRRHLDTLRDAGFTEVYFRAGDAEAFLAYLAAQVRDALGDPAVDNRHRAGLLHETTHLVVERAFSDARLGRHIDRGQEHIAQVVGYVHGSQAAVQALAETLSTDPSLYNHSVNVFVILVSFCSFLGLAPEVISVWGLGALFHDIGKRHLPEQTLMNPGKLSEEEWRLMHRHPVEGFEELRAYPSFPAQALRLVRHHHENLDGSGYPGGLRQGELDPVLRIIRIVDSYDAITSERRHRPAERPLSAIQVMRRDMASKLDLERLKSFVMFLGYAGRG